MTGYVMKAGVISNFSSLVAAMQHNHDEHMRNCTDPSCRCKDVIEIRGEDSKVQVEYSTPYASMIEPSNRKGRRAERARTSKGKKRNAKHRNRKR